MLNDCNRHTDRHTDHATVNSVATACIANAFVAKLHQTYNYIAGTTAVEFQIRPTYKIINDSCASAYQLKVCEWWQLIYIAMHKTSAAGKQ